MSFVHMEDFKLLKQVDKLTETLYSLTSQVEHQEQLIKSMQEKIKRLESTVYDDGVQK